MGFLDKLGKVDRKTLESAARQARTKVGQVVDQHGDKIADGIDKAAKAADQRTGGKHHDRIAQGAAKAKDGVRRLESDGGQAGREAGPTDRTGR
ncbi:antitoxin [Nocardioides sp. TRM66260-LWL]|uniref:antitoxin n=1 Tax=Nocardioides sp. TRM66260-LWL TaxID=2874478 RepID=UPI001CC625A3|nr:antitoxin [Nocardioides sp. TRM66260-LWL]MBZ5734628.1 antitoxin [Nocardioides sp. TRM66260-LWL]